MNVSFCRHTRGKGTTWVSKIYVGNQEGAEKNVANLARKGEEENRVQT